MGGNCINHHYNALGTVKPTGISLFDTQKWSLHVHYIEHRFNKEIQKSVEKQNEN